jgi:hypothetical protein
MTKVQLKESLLHIADKVDDKTSIEDVFKELLLLSDIEESEREELSGETYSQQEVEEMAKKWGK